MHASVMEFVGRVVEQYGLRERSVLEVGSLDVNGSVRPLFSGPYLATDMREGPGVDVVVNAHRLTQLGQLFPVIVCTEMLEHDDAPWLSLREMWSVSNPKATLILTCRGYYERNGQTECFGVHGYPDDFYRYSVEGIRALLTRTGWEPLEVIPDPQDPGVFAVARAT